MSSSDDSSIPGMFMFVPGMPVVVNRNTHQRLKLVNGGDNRPQEVGPSHRCQHHPPSAHGDPAPRGDNDAGPPFRRDTGRDHPPAAHDRADRPGGEAGVADWASVAAVCRAPRHSHARITKRSTPSSIGLMTLGRSRGDTKPENALINQDDQAWDTDIWGSYSDGFSRRGNYHNTLPSEVDWLSRWLEVYSVSVP